jgi:UDP-N-acetylmuramate dehydrogenase
VAFELTENGLPKLAYKDLREYFGDRKPDLVAVRNAVREIRAEKAMLVRQGGADSNSAGSFFKNPVVTAVQLGEIERAFDGEVPRFPAGEGFFKVPAAWLIEKSGFLKGHSKGNAGLSTKHTLAITNRGNATADEILALKSEIQTAVAERFGVELHPEPVFIGFE